MTTKQKTQLDSISYALAVIIDSFIQQQMDADETIMHVPHQCDGYMKCQNVNEHATLNENGAKLIQNYTKYTPVELQPISAKRSIEAFWNLVEICGERDVMKYGYLLRQYRNNWHWKLSK